MTNCPTKTQLGELIAGKLSDSVAETLTEHVGVCEACQLAMQDLASGDMLVSKLIAESVASAPPRNSAYWAVRESFSDRSQSALGSTLYNSMHEFGNAKGKGKASSNHSGSQIDSSDFIENELSFLEPSNDPAYIGRLQNFEILRVIGRGGMGIVLEGFDPHLHRSVAIKVLAAKFQKDPSAIERFCREGRAAASVSHEHVVQMHQVARVEDGEIAFLVMQLIDGQTLEDCLKRETLLAPEDVARIGMQIAAGLSAAHKNGLVHRDIKPGNVLIEELTGRVKLTDFGLARINDDVKLTKTGMLLGTALYMSPEQALGKPVDERSDLFSLGAVMYEMATGQSAFDAPTPVGVMKRIMDETPKSPHKINPKIGKPTSDLIMQLLLKKPNDRPDSAGEVARALASVVTEHGPISPLQVPAVASSEVKKLSKRHSIASRTWAFGGWIIASLLLACLALSVLAGWAPWGYPAVSNSSDSDKVSVVLNVGSDTGQSVDVTDQFPSLVLGGNPGTVWSIDFANDGETIAAGIGDGSVRLWNIERKEVVRSFNAHSGNVWNVKFHPSKNLFATAGDDSWVKLWDLDTFDAKQGWKLDNTVRAIAFSPHGNHLAAADRDGQLHIYDIQSGQEQNMIKLKGTTILGVDYSSDGRSIVAAGSDKTVRVFDAETLEQRQNFVGHAGPVYSVAFATDSPLIASVGFKSDTWVWNSETGESVAQLQGSDGDIWGVSFIGESSDHLLTGGQGGAARLWSVESGQIIATLRGHTAPVCNFALDPERKRIASSSRDGTIRVWDTSKLKGLAKQTRLP